MAHWAAFKCEVLMAEHRQRLQHAEQLHQERLRLLRQSTVEQSEALRGLDSGTIRFDAGGLPMSFRNLD